MGFEHQALLAVNADHYNVLKISNCSKGTGSKRWIGCQLCQYDKTSKDTKAFI